MEKSVGVPEVDPHGPGHGIGILVVAEGRGGNVDGDQEASYDAGCGCRGETVLSLLGTI